MSCATSLRQIRCPSCHFLLWLPSATQCCRSTSQFCLVKTLKTEVKIPLMLWGSWVGIAWLTWCMILTANRSTKKDSKQSRHRYRRRKLTRWNLHWPTTTRWLRKKTKQNWAKVHSLIAKQSRACHSSICQQRQKRKSLWFITGDTSCSLSFLKFLWTYSNEIIFGCSKISCSNGLKPRMMLRSL